MKRKLVEGGFQPIPAGEQTVVIKEVDETDYRKFDKLTVVIEDAGGRTSRLNFNFVNGDGEPNEVAEAIYARMCRAAMNDQTLDEVDTAELVGKFVTVEIVHNTSDKGGTFANVKKWIGPGEPFEVKVSNKDTASKSAATAPKKTAAEILAEMKAKKAAGK